MDPRCFAVSIGENGLNYPGIDEDDDDDSEGGQGQRADDALMQAMNQTGRPRNHVDENKVVKELEQRDLFRVRTLTFRGSRTPV